MGDKHIKSATNFEMSDNWQDKSAMSLIAWLDLNLEDLNLEDLNLEDLDLVDLLADRSCVKQLRTAGKSTLVAT
jgi:hypothetical protein